MDTKSYESYGPEETLKIAQDLAMTAKRGDVFLLCGDLGAGKTVFAKGFAKGLFIKEDVTSPTFTIINEYYSGLLPLYHFDVYRISSSDEMYETGFEERFYGDGVCLIEWAELISDCLPDNAVCITIKKDYAKSDNYRLIKIEPADLFGGCREDI